MTVAVAAVAAATATGNQDITAGGLGGATPKAGVFFYSRANADGVINADAGVSFGASDGTSQFAIAAFKRHGLTTWSTTTGEASVGKTDKCLCALKYNGSTAIVIHSEAAFVAFIPNGVRVNWTTAAADGWLVTALFFAGSDWTVACGNSTVSTSGVTTTTGFKPDAVMLFGEHADLAGAIVPNWFQTSIGAATWKDGTLAQIVNATWGGGTTNQNVMVNATTWAGYWWNSGGQYGVSVARGSSSFTLTSNTTPGTQKFGYLALKCTSGKLTAGTIPLGEGPSLPSSATFDGPATNVTLSNGNLTATHSNTTTNSGARSTAYLTTGKFYFEVTVASPSASHGGADGMGLISSSGTYANMVGPGTNCTAVYRQSGNIFSNNVNSGKSLGVSGAYPHVYAVAINLIARKAWFRRKSGSLPLGDWNGDPTADPETGVGGVPIAPTVDFAPVVCFGGTGTAAGDVFAANFGTSPYAMAIPTGFRNWGMSGAGEQEFIGFGGQPSQFVLFLLAQQTVGGAQFDWRFGLSAYTPSKSGGFCVGAVSDSSSVGAGNPTVMYSTANVDNIAMLGADGTVNIVATVVSLDADGLTLNFARAPNFDPARGVAFAGMNWPYLTIVGETAVVTPGKVQAWIED